MRHARKTRAPGPRSMKSEREKEAAGETREDGGTWKELQRELVFAESF